ncbi:hypothetical protein [Micromonospora sp. KLBMP9576]|uniref:hypothetical protein n=1 Tax=Micromonospora sp. KLBMP9576 TaxID=3424769 RepID=UPI003D8BCF54
MEYVSRVPQPPLDGLIDDLYYLEGASPYARLTLPPMPAALLIVNLGAPFRIRAGLGLVRRTSSVIAATSGAVAIGGLSVAAGVSSTHLARRFKELVGVTPKRLARTYRFAATVFSINPAEPIDWSDLAGRAGYFDRPISATSSARSPGSRRPGTSKSGGSSCASIPATCWTAGRCRPIDFLQEQQPATHQYGGIPEQRSATWAR